MNEKLEKLNRQKAAAEKKLIADTERENPSALHPCRNVGDLFERADRPDR